MPLQKDLTPDETDSGVSVTDAYIVVLQANVNPIQETASCRVEAYASKSQAQKGASPVKAWGLTLSALQARGLSAPFEAAKGAAHGSGEGIYGWWESKLLQLDEFSGATKI